MCSCSPVFVKFLTHVYDTRCSPQTMTLTALRICVPCFILSWQQLGHRVAGQAHEQRVRSVVYLLKEIMAGTRPLRERDFSSQGPRCVCVY